MGKQKQLPGMERKSIPEIEDAAEAYVKARDARMKLTETEHEAKETLIKVMDKHAVDVYFDRESDPPLVIVRVVGKDSVKVSVDEITDGGYSGAAAVTKPSTKQLPASTEDAS